MTLGEIVHKMDNERITAIAEEIVDGLKTSIMNNEDDISALSAKKTVPREIKWGKQAPPFPPNYLRRKILLEVIRILREEEEVTLIKGEHSTETNTDFDNRPFPVFLSLSKEIIADY